MAKYTRKAEWLVHHSLGAVAIGLVVLWIVGYRFLDPQSHLGAFCGNAIADWTGTIVIIFGTKFFYESGSAESRPLRGHRRKTWRDLFWRHSLLLMIAITGLGWIILYLRMNPQSKWGQVVSNIVSEWGQMAGLVFLTKKLVERGSKESR
jgi:membrane protease YdiL (CAAX protease family)